MTRIVLPLRAMMTSHSELPLRTISESVAGRWQGSVSMPVTHITIREDGGVSVQCSLWRPSGCLVATQNWFYSSLDVVPWKAVSIFHYWWSGCGWVGPKSVRVNWPCHCSLVECPECRDDSSPQFTNSSSQKAAKKIGSSGEVSLLFISCSAWESISYTSPGQHSRTNPGG